MKNHLQELHQPEYKMQAIVYSGILVRIDSRWQP
jgi:hypothetical protein